jgi:hypothetical protein
VLCKHELYGIGHIAQEVKAIGDLDGVGRAAPGTFSVSPGAIATDHFDTAMGLQPVAQGRSLAIGQQRNRRPAFYVDEHRAVALAFAVRPIINP